MTVEEFKKIIEKLPDEPGVYFFVKNSPSHGKEKGLGDEAGDDRLTPALSLPGEGVHDILYIGKATSLKDRVKSYFGPDLIETRGRLLVDMVALATTIDFVQTDSVLEALILEANLIKQHQPKYNTKEKDNKSYNYVVFTNEDYPKILTMRGRTLMSETSEDTKKYKHIFGPFPHGAQLKEAMKIIRRIFPYSDNKCVPNSGKPCFAYQIGLCPGVCIGKVSQSEYAEQIKNLKLFFEGKKKMLLKNLEKQMNEYADKQEFEKAGDVRKTVFALNHIQDIALLKKVGKVDESAGGEFVSNDTRMVFRIEAYDVAHSSGTSVVGVMTVLEDGELAKQEYRKFKIKLNPGVNDTGALREILWRRLGHLEWQYPSLIVVDGAQAQINVAESVLKERGLTIPVVSVVKDERHKPKEILGDTNLAAQHGRGILLANNEAHRFAITYHRNKRDKIG